MKNLLKPQEVAERLCVSAATVRGWIKHHKIPAVTLPSGQHRIKSETVQNILQPPTTK